MNVYLTTLYIMYLPYNIKYYVDVYSAFTVNIYQCHNFTSLLIKIDIFVILAKFRAYGPLPNRCVYSKKVNVSSVYLTTLYIMWNCIDLLPLIHMGVITYPSIHINIGKNRYFGHFGQVWLHF